MSVISGEHSGQEGERRMETKVPEEISQGMHGQQMGPKEKKGKCVQLSTNFVRRVVEFSTAIASNV